MGGRFSAEIGWRAAEEADRIFPTRKAAAKFVGGDRKLVWGWQCGFSPSALMLARLYHAGADVIYILTGRRSK